MPEQIVLNIDCQPREVIHDALNLLFHWTLDKKSQDPTVTGQHLATLIVAILSGLANEWWRWISQRSRDEIMNADDADQQLLRALGK